MQERIRESVEGETHFVKPFGQRVKNRAQFAGARHLMICRDAVIATPDILVKTQVWCAALRPTLDGVVKNTGDEERVIADVCSDQECLHRRSIAQRDQHIGYVLDGVCLAGGW